MAAPSPNTDPADGQSEERIEAPKRKNLRRWSAWVESMNADQRANRAAMFLLAALCFLAFANTFGNGFVYDDRKIIVENSLITSLANFPKIFSTSYLGTGRTVGGIYYRPLSIATYALNYAIGGLDPLGYHLVNLLIHLGVTLALYFLIRKLGCSWSAGLAGATLFAVHPIHTEAVTGIVGRAELLMALGVLSALAWYIKGRAPGGLRLHYAFASLAAFVLGLLAKEQAMMLPFILVLYEISDWKKQAGGKALGRNLSIRCVPYFIVAVLFLAAPAITFGNRLSPISRTPFIDNPLAHVDWFLRVLTAVKIAGKYLWLCLWPEHLSVDYSYNAIPISLSLWEPGFLAGLAAWVALSALAVWSFFRGTRLAFLAVGLMLLTFLPASNLLIPIGTIMGERLFYLPSAGLGLLVAAGWDKMARMASGKRISCRVGIVGFIGLALVISIFTGRTFFRNRDWQNEMRLFQSATAVVPANAKMRYNVGALKEDVDEALKDYEQALRIYPAYAKTDRVFAGSYGTALLKKGMVEEAVTALETAVLFGSKREYVHYNLGFAYARQGRWQEAEVAFKSALELDSRALEPRISLSFVLYKQGRYEEALKAAEEAVHLQPNSWEARFYQAQALDALARLDEAAEAYSQAFRLNPLPAVLKRMKELHDQTHG